MATVTKPLALNESLNTTEQTPRNVADVLSEGLENIKQAIEGGGAGGHEIIDSEGNTLPQETAMQFPDSHVSDDSTNGRTVVENVKEVTLAELEQATERGMYLATDEESVPIGASSEDYVEVTADGNKTYTQLLTELKSGIDKTKLQYYSTIVLDKQTSIEVHNIVYWDTNTIVTSCVFTNYAGVTETDTFYFGNSVKYQKTIVGNVTDMSSEKPTNGTVITLHYGSSSGIVELNTDARHCMMSDGVTSVESAIVPSGHSTDGLTFTDCTLVNGGYFKIGEMVVLNIRVKVTASSSVAKAYIGLPKKIKPSTTLIGLTAQQSTDDLPPIYSVISIGKIFMKNTTDNKEYVISGAWLA